MRRRVKAGAASVTPNGQPIRLEPRWNRDAREIKQIHEICVGAKITVEADRIGEHFSDRVVARCSRGDAARRFSATSPR